MSNLNAPVSTQLAAKVLAEIMQSICMNRKKPLDQLRSFQKTLQLPMDQKFCLIKHQELAILWQPCLNRCCVSGDMGKWEVLFYLYESGSYQLSSWSSSTSTNGVWLTQKVDKKETELRPCGVTDLQARAILLSRLFATCSILTVSVSISILLQLPQEEEFVRSKVPDPYSRRDCLYSEDGQRVEKPHHEIPCLLQGHQHDLLIAVLKSGEHSGWQ